MFQNSQISGSSSFNRKPLLQFKDNLSALKDKISKYERDILYSSAIAYHIVKATMTMLHQVKNFLLLSCKVAGSVAGYLFSIAGVVSWALQNFIINPIRVVMHLGLADAGKFYLNRIKDQYSALESTYQQGGTKAATAHLLKLGWGVLKNMLADCSTTGLISKYCLTKVLTAVPASGALLTHPATALSLLAIASCAVAVFLLVRNNLPNTISLEQQLVKKYLHNNHKSKAIKFLPKTVNVLLNSIQGKHYSKLEEDIEKYKQKKVQAAAEKYKTNNSNCATPFRDQLRSTSAPAVQVAQAA